MTKAEWWRDDSHPDAKEHRKHLERTAKEAAEQALAIIPTVPPSRPRRKVARISDKELEMIGGFVGKAIQPLQQRITELEARPVGLDYKGVWTPNMALTKNAGVTHQGSIWVAEKDNPTAEPGRPNSGFRLAVKRGRDGKDGAVK